MTPRQSGVESKSLAIARLLNCIRKVNPDISQRLRAFQRPDIAPKASTFGCLCVYLCEFRFSGVSAPSPLNAKLAACQYGRIPRC